MTPRNLAILLLLAVALAGATLWVAGERRPLKEGAADAQPLLPGLHEQINEVGRVRILGAGNETLATLVRRDQGWVLEERGGYPANVSKLRELLLGLAQARRLEAKTAKPELHARLGVEDVSAEDASGVAVEVSAGEHTHAVVVGESPGDGRGSYVRLADEPQAWLVDRALVVERDPAQWLQRELTQIDASRVARVEIAHPDGERIDVAARDDAPGFALANLPKGRELQGEQLVAGVAGLLSSLRLEDVEPVEGERPFGEQETSTARFTLRDGIIVEIEYFHDGDFVAAIFDARLDEQRAQAHITAEQARVAMEHERTQRATGGEAEQAAASQPDAVATTSEEQGAGAASGAVTADPAAAEAGAPPLAVSDPQADREARLAALREEVESLNMRFQDWAFTLPPYKAEHLTRRLDAYLAPKP